MPENYWNDERWHFHSDIKLMGPHRWLSLGFSSNSNVYFTIYCNSSWSFAHIKLILLYAWCWKTGLWEPIQYYMISINFFNSSFFFCLSAFTRIYSLPIVMHHNSRRTIQCRIIQIEEENSSGRSVMKYTVKLLFDAGCSVSNKYSMTRNIVE